ncbi:hypothetical protein RUM43_012080 [Polyplax serrata]|uniref:Flavin-containing monooxygenase n=1 Tax=Polyplax serrata TaxID=468196 RepID=A0AAN8S6Q8_POLSC
MVLKVAVIGAGAAGLASARRLSENPMFSFVVYEQTDSVGGTWVYDERTGVDEYGIPIHTSMYKNLRTNLPKEVMGFPGFPIIEPTTRSYLPATSILAFLKRFAEAFGLNNSIKFRHIVRSVKPLKNESGWRLEVENLPEGKTITAEYDAVMICNGLVVILLCHDKTIHHDLKHYEVPNMPVIPGMNVFSGIQIHSHDYRMPDFFKDMTVVVIGAGPSGLDIGLDLTSSAKQVYLSHHSPDKIDTCFPKNFTFKPDVEKLTSKEVFFMDGTAVQADCVLYCTGYLYRFPFLSEDCGVKVRENYVHPLYKHVIAIDSPSLAFIGLPFYVCAFSMFDLQARFFIESLTGRFKLPSKEDMLRDENDEFNRRKTNGFGLRDFHKMGPLQMDYYNDLSETAKIEALPPVLTLLHNESSRRFLEDLNHFRNDNYIIVDNQNFKEIK